MDYTDKINRFLAYQTSLQRSQQTIKAYKETLNDFFIEYLEQKPLDKITHEDIQLYTTYKQKKAQQRKKVGISGQGAGAFLKNETIAPTTMNRHFAAIKQFLTFYNYSNTAKQIKTLKIQKQFDIVEYEDIKKIFEQKTLEEYYEQKTKRKNPELIQFYSDRMKLLLDFDLAHGLRLAEVTDLLKSDLKFDRKLPIVEVKHGKGGKTREIALSPTWVNQYKLFMQKYPNVQRSEKVFTNHAGGALSYSSFRTYVKNLGYFIGVPRLSFHKLRHCYAIKRYEKDKDLVALSRALGHDNIQTTMIYLSKVGLRQEKQIDILEE